MLNEAKAELKNLMSGINFSWIGRKTFKSNVKSSSLKE